MGTQLPVEAQRNLGELQAQMIGERYDEMKRVERATWFARSGVRALFDWLT